MSSSTFPVPVMSLPLPGGTSPAVQLNVIPVDGGDSASQTSPYWSLRGLLSTASLLGLVGIACTRWYTSWRAQSMSSQRKRPEQVLHLATASRSASSRNRAAAPVAQQLGAAFPGWRFEDPHWQPPPAAVGAAATGLSTTDLRRLASAMRSEAETYVDTWKQRAAAVYEHVLTGVTAVWTLANLDHFEDVYQACLLIGWMKVYAMIGREVLGWARLRVSLAWRLFGLGLCLGTLYILDGVCPAQLRFPPTAPEARLQLHDDPDADDPSSSTDASRSPASIFFQYLTVTLAPFFVYLLF